jgi:hypothetical protein
MLTQAENQAARKTAANFLTEATAYKVFLDSHKLPLSLDTAKLLDIYRGRLFEQLLAADTGLKARYDLARTKEGQRQIQVDTMAGISLAGHELPEQLAQAIAELEQAYRRVPFLNDVPRIELAQLASGYALDYGRYLDQYTMNWVGKELGRAHFEQVAATLTQWRDLVQATNGTPLSLSSMVEQVTRPFSGQVPASGAIALDEKKLYDYLSHNPQLLEALASMATTPAPAAAPAEVATSAPVPDAYRQMAQQLLDDPAAAQFFTSTSR